MTRPILSRWLARCLMILSKFDLTFIPLKVIIGQALVNFLNVHPISAISPINNNLPNESIMRLDGMIDNH